MELLNMPPYMFQIINKIAIDQVESGEAEKQAEADVAEEMVETLSGKGGM